MCKTTETLLDIANRRWWAKHNITESNRIASGPRYGNHGMELMGRRSVSARMVRLPAAAVETGQDAMMPDVKLSANHREVTSGRGEGRFPGHLNMSTVIADRGHRERVLGIQSRPFLGQQANVAANGHPLRRVASAPLSLGRLSERSTNIGGV